MLRSELHEGSTVLVEAAPDGSDEEVKLSVVKPEKKPTPVAVGGGKEPAEEPVDDGGALDQPAVPPPTEE